MKKFKYLILGICFSLFLSSLTAFAGDPWTAIERGLDRYDRLKTKTQNTIIQDVNSVRNMQQNSPQSNQNYNQQNSNYQQQDYSQQQYNQQYSQQQYNQGNQQQYNQQYNQQQQQYNQGYQQQYNQGYEQQSNQQQQYPAASTALTLGSLPQGAVVVDANSNWNFKRMKNYTGKIVKTEPIAWIVVAQGNYGQGKTLLMSKDVVAEYNFYGKNQNSMTNWQNSDLRAWLRSTFYNHFSPQFKNAVAVINTETPTMAGKPQITQDNVFILSINELGLANRAKNGKNTAYFVDDEKRKAYQSVGVSSKGKDNYQPERYWIRTYNKPNKASGYGDGDIFIITNQGIMNSLTGNNWACGVRPAVNIKSDTVVSGPHSNGSEQYYILFN